MLVDFGNSRIPILGFKIFPVYNEVNYTKHNKAQFISARKKIVFRRIRAYRP
jgi:hypothetical protein